MSAERLPNVVRRSFRWAQHPVDRQWWLVEMEDGEPRRAFRPPRTLNPSTVPYHDNVDDPEQIEPGATMDPASRGSFQRWTVKHAPSDARRPRVEGEREVTERGFRVYARGVYAPADGPSKLCGNGDVAVAESSIAYEGPHVRIYGGRSSNDHVHLSYANARIVRDALDRFLAEAELGMLTEKLAGEEAT